MSWVQRLKTAVSTRKMPWIQRLTTAVSTRKMPWIQRLETAVSRTKKKREERPANLKRDLPPEGYVENSAYQKIAHEKEKLRKAKAYQKYKDKKVSTWIEYAKPHPSTRSGVQEIRVCSFNKGNFTTTVHIKV